MTLLMASQHTWLSMMDFDTFLDALRATLIPGTLPTLNLLMKLYSVKKFTLASFQRI